MTNEISEYEKQAEDFLAAHNLKFRAVYVGEDCPLFCEDAAKGDILEPGTFPRKNHIHGSHFRLTISGEGRGHLTIDYWDSYCNALIRNARKTGDIKNTLEWRQLGFGPGDSVEAGVKGIRNKFPKDPNPVAYDILSCIQKYDPGTFENFCSDYGYDNDSRRAEQTYHAVVKEWSKVQRFFTADELAELQEVN